MTHHTAVSISCLMRLPDAQLHGLLLHNGRPMTAGEARIRLKVMRQEGYAYIPPCDNVGPDGRCLGHEKNSPANRMADVVVDSIRHNQSKERRED